MRNIRPDSTRKKLLILVLTVIAVIASWIVIRSWLKTVLSISDQLVQLLDVLLVFAIGILIITVLSRLITSRAADLEPSHINTIKLLLQSSSFAVILLIVFSITGTSLVTLLAGVGFFGIVIGLAAQTVLGNIFSGLMLIIFRPFKVGDRIALINWQYGKFPPSISHGWLEPSYTGIVREVTVIYTRIFTDSNTILSIPNGVVSQSLVINLYHNKQGSVGTQFEVPLRMDPDDLHKSLKDQLSKMEDFRCKEECFEILEISPSSYVVAVNYRVEGLSERDMKSLLLRAIRTALVSKDQST